MTATIAYELGRAAIVRILGVAVLLLLGSAPARANDLQAVTVSQGADGAQVVRISLSAPLQAAPLHFTTSNPHRLVLDLPGIRNPQGRLSEVVNAGVVRTYSVAQTPDRTRLVLDLAGPAAYDVRQEGNVLLVVLRGADTGAGKVAAAHFDGTGSAHGIRDVTFRRGKNGEGRIEVALSAPGVGVDIRQKGQTIEVDFLGTSLPASLRRRLDVSDFATPARAVETYPQGSNTRMTVVLAGKWDYFAYQTGKEFILEVTPLEAAVQAPGRKRYEGERLSLDFQNVEVRAVLKVIADFTGLNIVAAESVSGNITLRLKDVPWDQALDIIMRARGLDKRVNGNVIWIEKSDDLLKREEEAMRARKASEELDVLVTRNYRLNYIRADDAMIILSGGSRLGGNLGTAPTCSPSSEGLRLSNTTAGANIGANTQLTLPGGGVKDYKTNRVLTDRGSASYDLTTNTLIITDIADRHAKVEEVLKGVDQPSKQVMIEARIVMASDVFGRALGARLGFQTRGVFDGTTTALGSGTSSARAAKSGVAISETPDFNSSLPANTTAFSNAASTLGLTLFNASVETLINLELQALEQDKRGKILSNPKVITTNLKPAVILQGTQIAYQTTSQDGTDTEFKDALLCLLVSPQILNNDEIIMDVEMQKDAPDFSVNPPAINVKRVLTQVRIKDGETAVLGGIFDQAQSNDTTKVPLLGDLPVLGALFRNNIKSDEKTEMLIFLTPRILPQ